MPHGPVVRIRREVARDRAAHGLPQRTFADRERVYPNVSVLTRGVRERHDEPLAARGEGWDAQQDFRMRLTDDERSMGCGSGPARACDAVQSLGPAAEWIPDRSETKARSARHASGPPNHERHALVHARRDEHDLRMGGCEYPEHLVAEPLADRAELPLRESKISQGGPHFSPEPAFLQPPERALPVGFRKDIPSPSARPFSDQPLLRDKCPESPLGGRPRYAEQTHGFIVRNHASGSRVREQWIGGSRNHDWF